MTKFIIQPHGRLNDWVADEKGYFTEEGLDYELKEAARTRRDSPLSIRRFLSMTTGLERSNVMPKDMDARVRAPATSAVLVIGR